MSLSILDLDPDHDLIKEIFSWLPVSDLLRLRSVCKDWKSLIDDPTFAKLHLERSPKHTYILLSILDLVHQSETWIIPPHSVRSLLEYPVSTLVNEDRSYRFRTEDFHAIGSSNGLICLIRYKPQENGNREICSRFWNPALRLKSELSPTLYDTPSNVIVHLGFGYDVLRDTYKVVAVFWDHTMQKWQGRIHCMGDSCWRNTLRCPDFPTLLGETLVGPFVNGSVNWLALNHLNCHQYEWANVTAKQLVIFSLDLRSETCKYMMLPDGLGEKPQAEPTLAVLRDCLFLYYDHKKTHFVLWEMSEFGVQESWTLLVNVRYEHLQSNGFVPHWLMLPVCLFQNGDVLMLVCTQAWDNVIIYNRRDRRVEHVELPNNIIWYAEEYTKSLVLPLPNPGLC